MPSPGNWRTEKEDGCGRVQGSLGLRHGGHSDESAGTPLVLDGPHTSFFQLTSCREDSPSYYPEELTLLRQVR